MLELISLLLFLLSCPEPRPFSNHYPHVPIFPHGTEDALNNIKQNVCKLRNILIRPYRQGCKEILNLTAIAITSKNQEHSLLSTKFDIAFTDFPNKY